MQSPDLARLKEDETAQDDFLDVFGMTLARLRDNEAHIRGEQPVNTDGDPVYAPYMSEEQIRAFVAQAYGEGSLVLSAMRAAYEQHYKELLEERN